MGRVVCVFAHPDDEAFGPSGTIAKLAEENDIYIICATRGEACGSELSDIDAVRTTELENSASILGVKEVFFLDFKDGCLCNLDYHALAERIDEKVKKIKPSTLLTFEPRGLSGHIDHFAITMTTTYVFYKNDFAKTLLYYCMSEEQRKFIKNYFIYFPPGYAKIEVNKVVDVKGVFDKKIAAIKAHKSQKNDGETMLTMISQLPKEEYFLELTK